MSARRIPKQQRSVSGLFWSLKNGGRHIPYESGLELDFCTVLELDAAVESFESQPLAVTYVRSNGRLCRGFPDFLVAYRSETRRPTELIDVKGRDELRERWAHLKPRLRAACGYARARGWLFRLRTEKEIRTQFLTNAKYLLRFLRDGADPEHGATLVKKLRQLGCASIGELLNTAYPNSERRALAVPTLWNLMARHMIVADLNTPLAMTTTVELARSK